MIVDRSIRGFLQERVPAKREDLARTHARSQEVEQDAIAAGFAIDSGVALDEHD